MIITDIEKILLNIFKEEFNLAWIKYCSMNLYEKLDRTTEITKLKIPVKALSIK